MEARLHLDMLAQPDETTCGPTALHALYRYYDDDISLEEVIGQVHRLEAGGTLAVFLACHALERGYKARIYTYNLHVFDPTWFAAPRPDLARKLELQMKAKEDPKLRAATKGYLQFLSLGGELIFEDLTTGLIRRYLSRSIPVLAGLSATYLYQCTRERGADDVPDDIAGEAVGHFVVLCGYDRNARTVMVADPYRPNPVSDDGYYQVGHNRVLCAVLLAVLTYDANILIIQPAQTRQKDTSA